MFAERQTGQAGGRGASQKNLIRASFMQWLARSAYGGSAGRRAIRSSARYVIGRSFNEADRHATDQRVVCVSSKVGGSQAGWSLVRLSLTANRQPNPLRR